jgi:hypothetical protein
MKMPKENAKTHHKHSPLTPTNDAWKEERVQRQETVNL